MGCWRVLGMNKAFVNKFWGVAASGLRASSWVVALFLCLAATLFTVWVQAETQSFRLFGMSRVTLLAVGSSMLASTIFWILHELLSLLKTTPEKVESEYFERLQKSAGIHSVHPQRGGEDAQRAYSRMIARARNRIWAVGMTNGAFVDQHFEKLISRCRERRGIDARICYWDYECQLNLPSGKTIELFEAQERLEKGVETSGVEWNAKMREQLGKVLGRLDSEDDLRSAIRVFLFAIPTNISVLVVDDDLFFFPFLSNSASNFDPHIHCSASCGVGGRIVGHYEKIMGKSHGGLCREILSSATA